MTSASIKPIVRQRWLRAGLALLITLVMAAVMIGLGFSLYQNNQHTAAMQQAKAGREVGQTVLEALNTAMLTNNRDSIHNILAVTRTRPDINRISIIGPTGHIYVSSDTAREGDTASTGAPGCVECHRFETEALPWQTYLAFQPGTVRTATPIAVQTTCNSCHVTNGQPNMGVVLVDISLAAGETRATNVWLFWLVISIGIALAIGVGLYWWLGPRQPVALRRSDRPVPTPESVPATQRRWRKSKGLWLVVILFAVGGLIFIGGTATALQIESSSTGCASCHTQPESTYVTRAQAAPIDLASAHAANKVACIDCHSGVGLPGRLNALFLGARNAALYVLGQYHNPAVTLFAPDNSSCTKCHAEVLTDTRNHYHFYFAQWQAQDASASCVSCHTAHPIGNLPEQHFVSAANRDATCERCHATARTVTALP